MTAILLPLRTVGRCGEEVVKQPSEQCAKREVSHEVGFLSGLESDRIR